MPPAKYSTSLDEMFPLASCICVILAMATCSFAIPGNSTTVSTDMDRTATSSQQFAAASSSVIVAVIPMLALIYCCPLYLLYRHSKRHPRPINKVSGARLQQYGPAVYVFLVFSSLAEIALVTWLLLQYRHNDNAPNTLASTGVRVLLFAGCWTMATAGTYTLFFLDPYWSKHPIASIGTQAVWILLTWIFWVVGVALLNQSLSEFSVNGSDLAYRSQTKGIMALAVVEISVLTLGMSMIMWLAWGSTREMMKPW